ncbi:hypothetical protein LIA77_08833 [Sarocladium implicatum]|nr:hypothetical protein LIA77_08833 [Sarocladium implicatum]
MRDALALLLSALILSIPDFSTRASLRISCLLSERPSAKARSPWLKTKARSVVTLSTWLHRMNSKVKIQGSRSRAYPHGSQGAGKAASASRCGVEPRCTTTQGEK